MLARLFGLATLKSVQVSHHKRTLLTTFWTVNGNWSSFTPCATCGPSVSTRTCTNPTPAGFGADCIGPSQQTCPTQPACSCAIRLSLSDHAHFQSRTAELAVVLISALQPLPANQAGVCRATLWTAPQNALVISRLSGKLTTLQLVELGV